MDTIKKLKELGFSKWKIAKLVGVSWQTIHMWEKGVFKASKKHQDNLDKLIKDNNG